MSTSNIKVKVKNETAALQRETFENAHFFQGQASGPQGLRPGGEGKNFHQRNTFGISKDKI